jgi:hypothetical protein
VSGRIVAGSLALIVSRQNRIEQSAADSLFVAASMEPLMVGPFVSERVPRARIGARTVPSEMARQAHREAGLER